MKTKIVIVLLACVGLFGIANATLLAPGTSAPPDVFAGLPGATLLASVGGPFSSSNPSAVSGSYEAAVYRDASGFLDFVYQVTNNAASTDSINRLTATVFAGFTTDVGYTPNGSTLPGGIFTNGTASDVPQTVDRSPTGDTVGFQIAAAPNGIAPGETSVALIIETNAQFFTSLGSLNVIDGGVTSLRAFAPTLPDGGSAVTLLGVALAGIEFLRRKFKS